MVNLVDRYLKLNLYFNAKEDFGEYFLSHPNYPSVFAITDSLDLLSIENMVIKVPKEQLGELPSSFLAIFNENLVLVVKKEKILLLENEKGVKSTIDITTFCEGWSGVIVAIEPNDKIVSKDRTSKAWIAYCIVILILVGFSIYYNYYTLSNFILLTTSLIGTFVSVLIVQEKLGFKNEFVAKLCNTNASTSCDSVIQSKKGVINKWINFTDASLLFFSINTISILLNPVQSSKTIGLLSILSFPIIIFSLFLQKYKIKKWCLLCLVVSFIIVTQGIVGYFLEMPILSSTFFNDFIYLFSFVFLTAIWLFIKPLLEMKFKLEGEIKELKKFKRNYSVFRQLSKEIIDLDGFEKLVGIHFGNSKASVFLTIILSPSCGYCHKVFTEAIQLVQKYPEQIFLNILFNINPENKNNPYKAVVENLLMINDKFPEKIEKAIFDWHFNQMKLEVWLNKWQGDLISMKVNQQIQQQYDWCLKNNFNYTPVKIVNEKLYPDEYNISELKYFISDFSEDKMLFEMEVLTPL